MSFQQRITESNDAHNKLQSHLSKTMQEIYDQEKHIEALKKAIRDKGPPLKVVKYPVKVLIAHHLVYQVSQTRLEARTHRPDVELCRDPPHHRLVEEVKQLKCLCVFVYLILYLCIFCIIVYSMCPVVLLCIHITCSKSQVGQLQESIDLLNRKLNEAEMAHQASHKILPFAKQMKKNRF